MYKKYLTNGFWRDRIVAPSQEEERATEYILWKVLKIFSKKFWKSTWQMENPVLYYASCREDSGVTRKWVEKIFKKIKKSTWQTENSVIY